MLSLEDLEGSQGPWQKRPNPSLPDELLPAVMVMATTRSAAALMYVWLLLTLPLSDGPVWDEGGHLA